MHLMYYLNDKGERVYTLLKVSDKTGAPTESAHPARFSPDDRFSKFRIITKERHGLLLHQQPELAKYCSGKPDQVPVGGDVKMDS